jgi:hypothetical protein
MVLPPPLRTLVPLCRYTNFKYTQFSTQVSAPKALIAGKKYFFRMRHMEASARVVLWNALPGAVFMVWQEGLTHQSRP